MPTVEEIRGALARGYCADNNTHKEVDTELLEACTQEVIKLLEAKNG